MKCVVTGAIKGTRVDFRGRWLICWSWCLQTKSRETFWTGAQVICAPWRANAVLYAHLEGILVSLSDSARPHLPPPTPLLPPARIGGILFATRVSSPPPPARFSSARELSWVSAFRPAAPRALTSRAVVKVKTGSRVRRFQTVTLCRCWVE